MSFVVNLNILLLCTGNQHDQRKHDGKGRKAMHAMSSISDCNAEKQGGAITEMALQKWRACQMSREGVVQRIRRPRSDFELSTSLSALYSLQALESRVGDQKLQCHLGQWLIDGGTGVLGLVARVDALK